MNVEEFLPLIDRTADRELIGGHLRQTPRRFHTRAHAAFATRVGSILKGWEQTRPHPRPCVHGLGAGFLLRRDPDTLIGADLSVASAEQMTTTPRSQIYFDGPPVLAVEIIEPWDTHGEIVERIGLYREAGAVVWKIDPDLRLIDIYRPGHLPEYVNTSHELAADPYLPGFRVPVAELFSR